jgi:hypothetical protein
VNKIPISAVSNEASFRIDARHGRLRTSAIAVSSRSSQPRILEGELVSRKRARNAAARKQARPKFAQMSDAQLIALDHKGLTQGEFLAAISERIFPYSGVLFFFQTPFQTARNGRLEKPDFTGFLRVKPDHRHRRLLRARSERPRRCRTAAKQDDEIAPSYT